MGKGARQGEGCWAENPHIAPERWREGNQEGPLQFSFSASELRVHLSASTRTPSPAETRQDGKGRSTAPSSCQRPAPPRKEPMKPEAQQREPTSLREAAARCNGVSQTVSFALTLAPEEEQKERVRDARQRKEAASPRLLLPTEPNNPGRDPARSSARCFNERHLRHTKTTTQTRVFQAGSCGHCGLRVRKES